MNELSAVATMSDPVAFVNPDKREGWEADHRLVEHTDLREHCEQIISDAMKRTAGL